MSTPAICAGEDCGARGWPMHRVHNQERFLSLCTSCVLKSHAGTFCTICFSLIAAEPTPLPSEIVQCSGCSMVSHLKCLPDPNFTSQFLCPKCKRGNHPRFRYFGSEKGKGAGIALLKGLHLAERLAGDTLRIEVERLRRTAEDKARKAVEGKRRARKWIEVVMDLHKEEVEKKAKDEASLSRNKVVKNREVEKWTRWHEMIPSGSLNMRMSRLNNVGVMRSRVGSNAPNGVVRPLAQEVVGRRLSQSAPQDLVANEVSGSTMQDLGLEEEKKVISGKQNGSVPRPNGGNLISRTNSRPILRSTDAADQKS